MQTLSDPRFKKIMEEIQKVIHDDTRYQKGTMNMRTQKCFAIKVGNKIVKHHKEIKDCEIKFSFRFERSTLTYGTDSGCSDKILLSETVIVLELVIG